MNHQQYSLAIVDDHQIVLDGLHSLLHNNPDFKIVLETTDPIEMLKLLQTHKADILLTDVMMPGLTGAELAKEVKNQFPSIKILTLSMSGQAELVNQMIRDADISGYVLKNIGQQELISALKKIAEGGIYFSEEVLEEILKETELKKKVVQAHLSQREIEIINLIEKEFNNKEIAQHLFLSERTVETHRKNIFKKTQTHNLIGLVKYAYEHKLIVKN